MRGFRAAGVMAAAGLLFLSTPSAHSATKALYVSVLVDPEAIETRKGADRIVDRAVREGYSELFVQVYRANKAWFPSEWAESMPSELKRLIRRAHKKGLKVHAWLNLLSLSANEKAEMLRMFGPSILTRNDQPKRSLKDHRIDGQYFLEPGDPHVASTLVSILEELLKEHPDLDGIHLDYIRYPDVHPSYGHTAWNLSRYRAAGGQSVEESDPEWRRWKRQQVTALVRAMRDEARRIKPGIAFSTSGLMTYTRAREESFQDWKEWVDSGLTDFVTLMCYTKDPGLYERYLKDAERRLPGLSKVNIAVGAYKLKEDPEELKRQWDLCEASKARSCVLLE